jgi:hypothetical protein
MRSYMNLAVLALAASVASPVLSAPTQYYRYGNLLVEFQGFLDKYNSSRVPRVNSDLAPDVFRRVELASVDLRKRVAHAPYYNDPQTRSTDPSEGSQGTHPETPSRVTSDPADSQPSEEPPSYNNRPPPPYNDHFPPDYDDHGPYTDGDPQHDRSWSWDQKGT